jgi:hypothetical protein
MAPRITLLIALAAALVGAPGSGAYGWPLKPFDKPHPIRGAFGDPRYHLGVASENTAFHFGVDIVARDGQRVYAVEPGYVHAYASSVTVTSRTDREFGYWHVKPAVRTGMHVRAHQLLGTVRPGWGHVHFAESKDREYKNPLRKRALSPFYDKTVPVVDSLVVGQPDAMGIASIVASIYDVPPLAPPAPWNVARLAPATVWWSLNGNGISQSALIADFGAGLPPSYLYPLVYAAGTYQNKANRPGRYLFRSVVDTSTLPTGTYTLTVSAMDTRHNVGSKTVELRAGGSFGP